MNFKQVILTILISFLVSLTTFSAFNNHAFSLVETEKKDESVYDRVMRTKTIRCGYFVRPLLMNKDPNTGKLSGILYDIMNEIGKKLSLNIVWSEEISPADYVAGLVNNRYDLVCTGWVSAQRSRIIDNTQPILYERVAIFTQKNNSSFDKDASVLNNRKYKMSVIDGNVPFYLTQVHFPKARKSSIPENAPFVQVLLDVDSGKSDAAIYSQTEASLYMQANPNHIKIIPPLLSTPMFLV